jgi:AraC-like DNA-binding protein
MDSTEVDLVIRDLTPSARPLQEARRRLLAEHADAASIGFEVGYESPSQFSREYRRMFGSPPQRDATAVRRKLLVPVLAG